MNPSQLLQLLLLHLAAAPSPQSLQLLLLLHLAAAG
jgi:hypothetical protein